MKFTKEGGVAVTVETEDGEKQNTGIENSRVVVSVKDTGTGIDPEIMPRLFSKFVTKSGTGTGL